MKKALAALVVLAPAPALAQVYGDVNTTLDPGSTGTQGPRPTPPPAPTASGPAQPNVVVVDKDGNIISQTQPEAAESGYYISGDQPAYAEPIEVHAGPLPELHVVRRGDTLWDISSYYFNNPWEWPKVWSYNPQITNPHWIYPGDLVRLLPRGMFAAEAPPTTQPEETPPQPGDRTLPAPARKLDVGIKQTAFVEKSDLDKSVTVDGSVDEKALLGDGDSVYLSYPEGKPPKVGERYSIYKPGKHVKQDGKDYGAYVQVLGQLEVVSVKQDKRARGVIVQANQEIERGAKVGPLVKTFKNVPTVAPKVDAQGPIVGILTRDQLIGNGEVVFVALGKGSGIEVGNRMYVVRRGDAYPATMSKEAGQDDRRFPARALGEIVIVDVGDKVSIGLVTLSVQEMGVGDLVMMQKSGQ
ncbi:MAG TPA: LysM peptidoglycan-binding domain-containing protein [Kofleriaceae bacterium]|nr:LysM peptidoglycan-binding domain-containing protein [Kofleriaceae bacterium]